MNLLFRTTLLIGMVSLGACSSEKSSGRVCPEGALGAWSKISRPTDGISEGAPAAWGGGHLVVWGTFAEGSNSSPVCLAGGGRSLYECSKTPGMRYEPVADRWQVVSQLGSPVPRTEQGAIGIGDRVVFWGGHDASRFRHDGGIYSPGKDTWELIPDAPMDDGRLNPQLIWAGSRLLVWGGWTSMDERRSDLNSSGGVKRGLVYELSSGQWHAMSTDGAPDPGSPSSASGWITTSIWTGKELLIWGAYNEDNSGPTPVGTGAAYDPELDRWRPLAKEGAPSPRGHQASGWTGSEMVVFGGVKNSSGTEWEWLQDGAAYNPEQDTWRPLSGSGAPYSGLRFTWTGTELAVWSGFDDGICPGGGIYDPATDRWRTINPEGAPIGNWKYMFWTGTQFLFYEDHQHYGTDVSGATFQEQLSFGN